MLEELGKFIPGSHNYGQSQLFIDPFTIAAVGIQAGTAISEVIKGNKLKNEAEAELNSFQRQDLTNAADKLKINTEQVEYKTKQYDQGFANAAQVLQRGGNFTGINSLVNQNLRAKQEISNDLGQQRTRLDNLRFQDEQRIRDIQENRDNQDLAGIGAKAGYGLQQAQQGVAGIGSAASNALFAVGNSQGLANKAGANSTQPQPQITRQAPPSVNALGPRTNRLIYDPVADNGIGTPGVYQG